MIDYIVAPYEADAQLAYLAMHNHVDGVITEDSDLIIFGAPFVLFKMDDFGSVVMTRITFSSFFLLSLSLFLLALLFL